MSLSNKNPQVVTPGELKSHAYCRRRAMFDAAASRAGDEELASALLELQTLSSAGGFGPGEAAEMSTLDRMLSVRRGNSWEGPEEILRETPFFTILGPCWKEVAVCAVLPAAAVAALILLVQ